MSEPAPAQTQKRFSLSTLLKILLTVSAVGYILWLAQPDRVLGYFLTIDLHYLGLAILIKPLTDAVKIRKWQILAQVQLPKFSFWSALRSFYIGISLAVVTPFAIGELSRGAFASEKDRTELAGLVLFDKVLDLGTVALYSLLGLVLLFGQPLIAFILILAYVLVVAFLNRIITLLEAANYFGLGRLAVVQRLASSVKTITPQLALRTAGLSLLYFILFYLQAAIIMTAYGEAYPFEAVLLFPIITLSTILPITIGGVGIREGTAILLLQRFNIPEAVAFNTFFMHFVVANVLAGLVGAVLFLLPQRDRTSPTT
ncbi:MAG: flippase-like domain-containing protein [Chloroflexi bacterium]|nr:flippase-like domain-containing protein [Chloroflexota bacterium]